MLDIETGVTQPVVLGIDPGSKMEGYTVKSPHRTFLNIQSHITTRKELPPRHEWQGSQFLI
jgi:hypothetical protein